MVSQARCDFLHRHAGGVGDGKGAAREQPLGGGEFFTALLQAGVAAVGIARLADGGEALRRQGQGAQAGQVGEQDSGQAAVFEVVRGERIVGARRPYCRAR